MVMEFNTQPRVNFRPEEEEEEDEDEDEGITFKIEHKMVGTVVKASRLYNTWYLI